MAWRIIWIRACPFSCPQVFLGLVHLFFLKLGVVLEAHMVLCMAELDFWEKIFCPQNGEIGPKIWFFEFIGKFSHSLWIWSLKKVYIKSISFTWENSKMFNITSKYLAFSTASWVTHITITFHTCYSCSYYSSMTKQSTFFI